MRLGGAVLGLILLACHPQAAGESVASPSRSSSVGSEAELPNVVPERLRVRVLESFPHDPGAFTQGLLWHEGLLYESTGHYGRSEVRRVDPRTGQVLASRHLSDAFFGEGLERVGDRLIQLTWKASVAFVYDLASLEPIGELSYDGEGWGLAYDGRRLIRSDGSSRLFFHDPETFEVLGNVEVALAGRPAKWLNELEFADGAVYANVWQEDRIYRIDPSSGAVTAIVDASGILAPSERPYGAVLNGIAWDPASRSFWITGKNWPKMFRVVLEPSQPD